MRVFFLKCNDSHTHNSHTCLKIRIGTYYEKTAQQNTDHVLPLMLVYANIKYNSTAFGF